MSGGGGPEANDNEPPARPEEKAASPAPTKVLGRDAAPQLPARFYKLASVSEGADGFGVALDGRALKTPSKLPLRVPSRLLAQAIAAEWAAQGERIDPSSMPLTRLANTAIDAVAPNLASVQADIVQFAGSDALCYRAAEPARLAELQAATWDPILKWAAEALGARFVTQTGILHVSQPQETLAAVGRAVAPFDAFQLTALHVMTTVMGSSVLALAVATGALDAPTAWRAAHLDEDWQIATWGSDGEATDRRERRWREMDAAVAFLTTLR
jgi:chaperone required for assembly of F1-ATPase